jgi:ATP-dependent Clp protease ATP-binding subunit ClpC
VGSWLLPGPTGVGKTEFAKVLADELGVELVRVDCSEYQHAHEISKLFGAPPGYVGFEDSRQDSGPPMTLAAKVKANPFCVVLFDELEKADKAIFNVLLQIMDDGVVTSGRGESIRFNEAVILMTSNVGTKEAAELCGKGELGFGDVCNDKSKLEAETINATIKELFSPEFLNRLTGIIQFNRLTKEVCRDITDVMLSKTKTNLEKAQHMTMSWDDTVKDYLLEEGYSEEYGARNIGRAVQKNLELPLAEWILRNKYIMGEDASKDDRPDLIKIKVKDGEFIFKEGKTNNGTKENNIGQEGVCDTRDSSKRRRARSSKTPSD